MNREKSIIECLLTVYATWYEIRFSRSLPDKLSVERRNEKIVIQEWYLLDEYVRFQRPAGEVQISCHRDSLLVVFAEDLPGRLYESGFRGISTNCYVKVTLLGSRPLNDEPRVYVKFISLPTEGP